MSRYASEKPVRRKKTTLSCVIAAISLTLLIISAAVLLTVNCRPLYYLDIILLNIEKEAGMKAEEIRRNYDTLITYNQIWHRGSLVFPTLPMSEEGAIHFAEVKRIFDGIWILFPVTALITFISGRRAAHRGHTGFFTAAGILSIVIPAIVGALALLSWDSFFVLFHRLLFNNDYWLFDPATDPVILMLPDAYFLHCLLLILVLILAGSVICLVTGRVLRGKR